MKTGMTSMKPVPEATRTEEWIKLKNVTTKLKSILEINNRRDAEKNEICDERDRFGNSHGIKRTKKDENN